MNDSSARSRRPTRARGQIDVAPTPVVVEGLPMFGGAHCETTALGILLAHRGVHLSEPLLFGLGAGLSFIYWDSRHQQLPFLGGRVKPFVLTTNVLQRLGLRPRVHETASVRRAWEHVRTALGEGTPVGLQLDCHDLEYFRTKVHFAGHMVVMRGYDEQNALLIDTAQQGGAVSTSLASLAVARAARGPMAARNRSFTVERPSALPDTEALQAAVVRSIVSCAEDFLEPPISNLGHRGIRMAAVRVRSWFHRLEDPALDLAIIASMMERAGTGGALFRNLYRDFLTECLNRFHDLPGLGALETGRVLFARSAVQWTRVAELLDRAGLTGDPTVLDEVSEILLSIAEIETDAMKRLRRVGGSS